MSSVYQPKRKELAKVSVVSTKEYDKNKGKLRFVGSINKLFPSFVTTKRNKTTGRCTYIEDTTALTKRTKGEVVKFFSRNENRKKEVLYLVVPKAKSNTSSKRGKRNG